MPNRTVTFTVIGTPKPQGSKRAFVRGNKAMLVESAGQPLKDWRGDVRAAAAKLADGHDPFDGPLAVTITCRFRKPKSAPKTKPVWPTTRATGDSDKLARAVNDALEDSGLIADDARIVDLHVSKEYVDAGDWTGAAIHLRELA